jgi:SAM-dependent methyltransferase
MRLENPAAVDVFLDEYSRDYMIARYLSRTAGAGVGYALTNVYAPVYRSLVRSLIMQRPKQHTFRILEYGCGGGMNLLKIIDLFREQRAEVETAIGTDFSARMIDAARQEAQENLPADLQKKIRFAVARNETLAQDLATDLGSNQDALERSFDIVLGVNTFRYCYRLNKGIDCARDIFKLLTPGGYSVMIDMNRRFPLFRSRIPDMLRRPKHEYYLPSLEEYTRPFRLAGFTIRDRRNFCWVPHSAKPSLVAVCRTLSPILDRCFSPFAMRSLVVAQRPTS